MTLARSRTTSRDWHLPFLLIPLVLAGCSSSGAKEDDDDDDEDNTNPPGQTASGDLSFFSGSLKAFDPAKPADIFTITPNRVSAAVTTTGTFRAADTSITDVTDTGVVYLDGDELRFVSSELGSNGQPQDSLLSAVPADGEFLEISPDFAKPENARVLIEYDNDEYEIVKIDGDGGAQPFPGEPLIDVFDTSTGALSGWLVEQSDELHFVDTDLQSSFLTTGSDFEDLGQAADGSVFLANDGFVQVYDHENQEITDTGYQIENFSFGFAIGLDDLFMLQTLQGRVELVRISSNGTVTPILEDTNVPAFPGINCFESVQLTDNRVVFSYETNDDCKLFSLTQSGNDLIELGAGQIDFPTAFGSTVAFNLFEERGAVVIDDDGANRKVYEDARWVGGTLDGLRLNAPSFSDLFLVKDISNQGAFGGATLHDVDAANPRKLRTNLGTLPNDIDFFFLAFGTGKHRVGFSQTTTVDPNNPFDFNFDTDVFVVEAGRANSLTRVTDTDDTAELPIEFGGGGLGDDLDDFNPDDFDPDDFDPDDFDPDDFDPGDFGL